MEGEHPPNKVCTPCLEDNLIKQVTEFKVCQRCLELFCMHGASRLDSQYCVSCCSDFKVEDTEETVIREVHNDQGDVTSSKHFRLRHITLSGSDWLFHNRAINTLTDLELDLAVEYHRAILNGMLNERDSRFVTRIQRNKGKKAGNENQSLFEGTAAQPFIHTGDGLKLSVPRTATRTTRTKTVRTTQSGASAQAEENSGVPATVMKSMLNLGYTKEQIVEMINKAKG